MADDAKKINRPELPVPPGENASDAEIFEFLQKHAELKESVQETEDGEIVQEILSLFNLSTATSKQKQKLSLKSGLVFKGAIAAALALIILLVLIKGSREPTDPNQDVPVQHIEEAIANGASLEPSLSIDTSTVVEASDPLSVNSTEYYDQIKVCVNGSEKGAQMSSGFTYDPDMPYASASSKQFSEGVRIELVSSVDTSRKAIVTVLDRSHQLCVTPSVQDSLGFKDKALLYYRVLP